MRAALVLITAMGCGPYFVMPTAIHPTSAATEKSVGVSAGGVYVNPEGQSDDTFIAVPIAEGWIRIPLGSGQLGVHLGPNAANLGYRFDVQPMAAGGGVGFAVEPMLGASYFRGEESDDPDALFSFGSLLTIAAGVNGIILVPTGTGHAYFVPKLAYVLMEASGEGGASSEEELYGLGLSAGIDLGSGASLELAVHRLDSAESDGATDAVWLVVPSFGIRH
jgi:hypothetical protein